MKKSLSFLLGFIILILLGTACQKKTIDLDETERIELKELKGVFSEKEIFVSETVVDENSNEEQDVPTQELKEETHLVLNEGDEKENIEVIESENAEDMTRDYIGKVMSTTPVQTCSFAANGDKEHHNDAFTLYTEKIDDGNFRFYIMKAKFVGGEGSLRDMTEEELFFKKHIAHYNGEGFYEYIGERYHLYFKYIEDCEFGASNSVMEVYGLNDIIDINVFGGTASYNDMIGITFVEGIPFAG